MRTHPPFAILTLLAVLAACSRQEAPPPAAAAAPVVSAASAPHDAPEKPGIAWRQAVSDADVDAAFADAKSANKPVFVYWGAKWCPPCNQVKATLFNRQDFIERSRAFVPVYIDGDSPGAQKLGSRFAVRGYPTMVLFNPAGAEVTRLPGEVDAAQYTQVLTLGISAQRPVKAVLADARTGNAGLSANDWKLLAFYSWETDEQQVLPKAQSVAVLRQLAQGCPADQPETSQRLLLKALTAGDAAQVKATPADRERVLALLADPAAARAQMDVLTVSAADLVRVLSAAKTPERPQLLAAFDGALKGLQADATLSRADRLTALIARVDLARSDLAKDAAPALPEALLAEVREQSARADREITDGYERQAVITSAADMLEMAGLLDESDALLKSNLAKSHSPYYLMLGLAANAKKRGDKAGALNWYEASFEKSEGPATRLQWGARYLAALVDLSPQDDARIERAAQQLFTEAAGQPGAFYERSGRSLQRASDKLLAWQRTPGQRAAVKRLQAQLDTACRQLPDGDSQRATCDALLKPAPRKTT